MPTHGDNHGVSSDSPPAAEGEGVRINEPRPALENELGAGRRESPGPSYLDEGSGRPENDFTNRNTTFMTWNLMHMARMLKDAGGIPAYGNLRQAWNSGERFGFNPEYR